MKSASWPPREGGGVGAAEEQRRDGAEAEQQAEAEAEVGAPGGRASTINFTGCSLWKLCGWEGSWDLVERFAFWLCRSEGGTATWLREHTR